MNFEYYWKRKIGKKSFDYLGNHIEYYLFRNDKQNPHPEEFGVRTNDNALVSDKVPELFRDIIAYHEFIELRGIMKNNYPQEGTLEGNRILYKLHLDAIKEEMKLAKHRGVLKKYKKWFEEMDKIYGPRVVQ